MEWGYNCQRCVVAYEMRQRGYDVQVTARPTETKKSWFFGMENKVLAEDHLSAHPFDAWIPPDAIACPRGQADIERYMQSWGDGARAEVMVLWRGEHGNGHVFVAQQINGYTHFIDPQTGEDGCAYYFDAAEKKTIQICRMDDKEPSQWIEECCRD